MGNINNDFIFHATAINQAAEFLDTNIDKGLDTAEIEERLVKFGPNIIKREEADSPLYILLKQFKSPIVYLLTFAVIMSFWFKEWLDGVAILIVIIINAVIGFYMEFRAQQSMLALIKLSSVPAKVLRGGNVYEINSEEIVPGDIVYVEAGDMVPADGKIYRASQLMVDESSLTGESVPVEKREMQLTEGAVLADRTNMVYKGCFVAKGNTYVLVCSTGMQTEIGKIAALVRTSVQAATPLEEKLERFTKKLIKITVGLVVVIFIAGLVNGQPLIEMLETSIALAVAAIPEGLPIVATLSLAQGMLKMARHNVIVKKLSAVETLGGTNVICTDKTGTLTQNKMEVVLVETSSINWRVNNVFKDNNEQTNLILKCAVLCNTASLKISNDGIEETGDPLEIALLRFAHEQKTDIIGLRTDYIKTKEEPFSSDTRIMATACQHGDGHIVFAKGAVEEIINRSSYILEDSIIPMSDVIRQKWISRMESSASNGYRMIAMAYKEPETLDMDITDNLIFLGIVGMIDPPRPEVLSAIRDCKTAGIKVVMITGDHPATAHNIGVQLGIADDNDKVLLGKDMKNYEELDKPEKDTWINTSIFARVNPKHKLDLVKVFQEEHYIVGMTGDGVNDAPALKKADIGISMGLRGTQVAQEVSDMVLKDDSFSSIVIAIRQGRIIFDNIKKFVTYLLSCNLSELLVIAIAAVMNLHFQLLPLQILFINLITDVLPALALGVTKGGADIMNLKPRPAIEPIIDNKRWTYIILYALVISITSIGSVLFNHYAFHKGAHWDSVMCNNILFFTLIITQLLHVLNMAKGNIFKTEVFKNRYVWYAILSSLAILLSSMQVPLIREALEIITMDLREWAIILSGSLTAMILIQLIKIKE